MKAATLTDGPPVQHVLVFEPGEEVVSGLTDWATENQIPGSSFTGVGAFTEATLGYYDLDRQEYDEIPVDGQVEVLVLAGDITLDGQGGWKVHGHVVCGRRDGSTVGGHLLRAVVRPTLELVVTASDRHLQRRQDAASGLALIDPAA
ncbi:PPC domain-containing DNA-binding protein [Blastococcus capsensis]|uniref:PPC domain-containing DNA-binding protein n=1 Tax=Blastococcus capsensis TaxID=1564163 RepID=UPI0025423CB3|nr:PPC domain-containing DNA-binding protein [Blastococcus capsensis]MDK3257257.1 DNA-binding protein [Blastococcus capsensis]